MKIKVEISEEIYETCCIIKTSSLNDQVNKIVNYIKTLDSNSNDANFVIGYDLDKEKTIIIKSDDIIKITVEDKKTYIFLDGKKYLSKKRLCELENSLGHPFFRVSKKALVNVNAMDNIEASFGGLFLLTLKNGSKEYISKKYLPVLKKYLGM